ncbi:MAG: hypothetical protein RSG48_03710 [Clostridia bacterium]
MLKMFLENMINKKRDTLDNIMQKLDIFFAGNRITEQEYTELQNLALDILKIEKVEVIV